MESVMIMEMELEIMEDETESVPEEPLEGTDAPDGSEMPEVIPEDEIGSDSSPETDGYSGTDSENEDTVMEDSITETDETADDVTASDNSEEYVPVSSSPASDSAGSVSGNSAYTGGGDDSLYYAYSSSGSESLVLDALERQTDILHGGFISILLFLGMILGALLVQGFRLRRV